MSDEGTRGARSLAIRFVEDHPADAAMVLDRRPPADAAAYLQEAPDEAAAAVLGRMAPGAAADVLECFSPARAAAIVELLPFGTVSAMLRRLGSERAGALLAAVPRSTAASLRLVLHRPADTAGALMDPRVLALPEDLVAAEAVSQIREAPRRVIYYLYVVDREQKLSGVLNMRELLLAEPDRTLREIMHRPVSRLAVDDTRRTVMEHPAWREHSALPVVDASGIFLGAIRYETLRGLEREDAPPVHPAPTLETAVELGELFWIALTGAFTGFTRRWGDEAGREEGR